MNKILLTLLSALAVISLSSKTVFAQSADSYADTAYPAGSVFSISKTIDIPKGETHIYFVDGKISFSLPLVKTYCSLDVAEGTKSLPAGTKLVVKDTSSPEDAASAGWHFESGAVTYMLCTRNMSGIFLQAKVKAGNVRNQFGSYASFAPPTDKSKVEAGSLKNVAEKAGATAAKQGSQKTVK